MDDDQSAPGPGAPLAGWSAVLLAAGESTRMGTAKPLLDWNGEPLVRYQIDQLERAGASEIVVVLGHRADECRAAIGHYETADGVRSVTNDRYRDGKATSIRCGLATLAAPVAAIVILAVDQPRSAALLSEIVERHRASGARLSIPVHRGRRGHPPVFDRSLLEELAKVSDESAGLRATIARHAAELHEIEVQSPAVLDDLNTPAAYERAREASRRDPPR